MIVSIDFRDSAEDAALRYTVAAECMSFARVNDTITRIEVAFRQSDIAPTQIAHCHIAIYLSNQTKVDCSAQHCSEEAAFYLAVEYALNKLFRLQTVKNRTRNGVKSLA
ncbi:hypothetical protein KO528_17210 [Saccharophagus degradans]|uniref:Ribosomal subunit interface protein n=1 Tax=Saccharophagus degradans TaxID=86304 RepID=A0AAW7X7H1_9GAMM|nr:hypothetical protein [Saccharophagus degradans]MBU2987109.1 hypothetical protein [Saccharophagus degradans]MDO6423810.1 hypothetical protein [Saccharophagus degradans]MDO6607890.1 hypothetical protein [Saccharophagus degradans]WGO98755.1 hypothetical protein QFX18_01605 [Saccharophagus degradans]